MNRNFRFARGRIVAQVIVLGSFFFAAELPGQIPAPAPTQPPARGYPTDTGAIVGGGIFPGAIPGETTSGNANAGALIGGIGGALLGSGRRNSEAAPDGRTTATARRAPARIRPSNNNQNDIAPSRGGGYPNFEKPYGRLPEPGEGAHSGDLLARDTRAVDPATGQRTPPTPTPTPVPEPPRIVSVGRGNLFAAPREQTVVLRKYLNPAVDTSSQTFTVKSLNGELQLNEAGLKKGDIFSAAAEDQTDESVAKLLGSAIAIFEFGRTPMRPYLRESDLLLSPSENPGAGILRDAAGQPIAGAKLTPVSRPPFAGYLPVFTNAKGEYDLGRIRSFNGDVHVAEVRVSHPEYGDSTFGRPALLDHNAIVPLVRAGSPEAASEIRGIVRDPAGAPVPGATVLISQQIVNPLVFDPQTSSQSRRPTYDIVMTDADGLFRWRPIPEPLYPAKPYYDTNPGGRKDYARDAHRAILQIVPPAGAEGLSFIAGAIELAAAAKAPTTFVLDSGAKTHRFAIQSGAKAMPITPSYLIGYYAPGKPAAMTLDEPGAPIPQSYIDNGGPMPAGTYWLRMRDATRSDFEPVEVGPESPETLAFQWKTKMATLRGSIVDAVTGAPLPNAIVFVGAIGRASQFAGFREAEWAKLRSDPNSLKSPTALWPDREQPTYQTAGDYFFNAGGHLANAVGRFEFPLDPGTNKQYLTIVDQFRMPVLVEFDSVELDTKREWDLGEIPLVAASRIAFTLKRPPKNPADPKPKFDPINPFAGTDEDLRYAMRWHTDPLPPRIAALQARYAAAASKSGLPHIQFEMNNGFPSLTNGWHLVPANLPVRIELQPLLTHNPKRLESGKAAYYLHTETFTLPAGETGSLKRIAISE